MAVDNQNPPATPDEPAQPEQQESKTRSIAIKVLEETGLKTIHGSPIDVKLLFAQRFARLFAYGGTTLVLASYLSALGISDTRIGLFMTLTLVGDVVISFFLTLFADAMGRKAILCLGSSLMVVSGIVFGLSGNYWVLLAAAIFGVISPSGNEIGPFRAVEESTLAHLVPKHHLPDIFAWYSLVGSAGTACGMITCGWISNLLQSKDRTYIASCRALFLIYAGIGVLKFLLSLALSSRVEAWYDDSPPSSTQPTETDPLLQTATAQSGPSPTPEQDPPKKKTKPSPFAALSMGPQVRLLLLQLSLLFALDSFASGLMPLSWMTYFFKRKFSLAEGSLGSIFFVTSIISALSTLVAASIARRIGNVKTMVFTHSPSAVMLALIPVPPTLPGALVFLVGRSCSQMMDVAPRSAFLAAALPSDKRTAIMGFINVVKTTAQSVGPSITGTLAGRGLFWVSFVLAGSLKLTYDMGMLITFAGRDESRKPKPATTD